MPHAGASGQHEGGATSPRHRYFTGEEVRTSRVVSSHEYRGRTLRAPSQCTGDTTTTLGPGAKERGTRAPEEPGRHELRGRRGHGRGAVLWRHGDDSQSAKDFSGSGRRTG